MTIEEIYDYENFSTRSLNVCIYNNLKDLSSILKYYQENKTFNKLRNCGAKSHKELIELCLKYIPYGNIKNINFISIDDIYNSEHISTSSLNVCNDNGLKDLFSILKYYKENKTFYELKNCDSNSNIELIDFCLKYMSFENINFKTSEISFLISNLKKSQINIINNFIQINFENLSNRSQNALTKLLNGNFKIANISEQILCNNTFNANKIENIGKKSNSEINKLIGSISEFIEKVSGFENEIDLISVKNRIFIEKTYSITDIPLKVLQSQSIFKMSDFLIKQNVILKKNQNIIFKQAFKIYDDQPELTFVEIADEINISRERVRQKTKNIIENLLVTLQFLRNIEDDLYKKYGIDQNQQLIYIDNDLNKKINADNETNFSVEFNTFLIYAYISDKFDLIGEIEDVLLTKHFNSRNRHNWSNFYIVNKNISHVFNFNAFADDIEDRFKERNEETYSFNFISYLNNFASVEDNSLVLQIFPVAEKIINQEFQMIIDLYDNIVFKRNTVKQVSDFAIEALEKLGVPSKIKDIYKLIEKENPEITKSQNALRGSLVRTPEIIYFGRSSTYGLKKWEIEKEGIKGGTIRNIVSKFLETQVEPKHISIIAEYVLNYRPNTNEKSILHNLKADETRTFIFFKNTLIGLNSKKYDGYFAELDQIKSIESKSWEERYNDFTQFINIHNRLPYSSGCPDEEIRLYRWHNVQEGKIKNGSLDNKKITLLDQITAQFDRKDSKLTSKSNNSEKYNDLKQFIHLNKRLPSVNKIGEENMYQFFNKQRRLFEKGVLDKFEKNSLIEIAKIIKNHKYENKRN